jgi:succinylglutamic semialdehyde dehydrogenase
VDGFIVGVNPGDRSDVLGRFSFSSTSVDDAVGAARDGLRTWSRLEVDQRAESIAFLGDLLTESASDLAILISRETGKPLWESREEVNSSVRVCRLLATEGARTIAPVILKESLAWSEPRPHGVVGVITPFTFPLLIPVLHVCSAMLAGNTVVFKPSKFTPGVGLAVAERMDRCKLPRGTFNLVQGSGAAVGQRIATHPDLDALLFAGSFDTAMAIRRATFERPELPTLYQCGGKGSAIVISGADLDRVAYDLAVSAFATTGQRHNSTGRVLVERTRFDEFCEALTQRTHELVVGYAFDEGVFMGPMISDAHRSRFRRHGKELVANGHTPILEATSATVEGHRGYYVRPSIYWVGVGAELDGEPVGPILHVQCVEDWEEAVEVHNRMSSRLSTAAFADPEDPRLGEMSARLSTGCLNVNRGTIGSSLRLPAVGQGRASNGIPSDLDLLRFLSTSRATLIDRRPFDSGRWVPGAGDLPAPEDEHSTMSDYWSPDGPEAGSRTMNVVPGTS